jgi:hypothetical protein
MALVCVGVLTLAMGVYVGAYYALVSAKVRTTTTVMGGRTYRIRVHSATFKVPVDLDPEYREILGVQPDWIFTPMHAMDRRLRPGVWRGTTLMFSP